MREPLMEDSDKQRKRRAMDKFITAGVAGHVDHGKTSLVRCLTGIDTDRLKEEKRRGLSIEPSVAPLRLPSGRQTCSGGRAWSQRFSEEHDSRLEQRRYGHTGSGGR